MKLREALAASNCGKVQVTEYPYPIIYVVGGSYNIKDISFVRAEKDIWAPVIENNKVTKTLEGWVNVYGTYMGMVHKTRDDADRSAGSTRIACVKVTGTYEVEE